MDVLSLVYYHSFMLWFITICQKTVTSLHIPLGKIFSPPLSAKNPNTNVFHWKCNRQRKPKTVCQANFRGAACILTNCRGLCFIHQAWKMPSQIRGPINKPAWWILYRIKSDTVGALLEHCTMDLEKDVLFLASISAWWTWLEIEKDFLKKFFFLGIWAALGIAICWAFVWPAVKKDNVVSLKQIREALD